MQRATTDKARNARRNAILSAAGEAFDRLGFAQTSMEWLAERAGVAKGTLYLYFPTKESVFLALYLRELDAWSAQLNRRVDELAGNDPAAFAGVVADVLEKHPRLPALAAIEHSVLERNIGEDEALATRRYMLERFAATGILVERKLDFLVEGDGLRLLLRLHALIIGSWHVSSVAASVRKALEHEDLAPFRLDFSEELENAIVLLLEGWRQCGGGF